MAPFGHPLVTICDTIGAMRFCTGYEDKERMVDAAAFQMGQGGWDLVQTHAVPVEAGRPAVTTACGQHYSRVNASLNWFDPKYAFAVARCEKCVEFTQ
jgi:hypothetical protein